MSTHRPLVLILGTDKYILQAAQRLDVEVVVAWGSGAYDYGLQEVPPGMTTIRVDDVANPESILMALHRAGLADRRFDAVQTSDEWAVITAGVLASYLGCRGTDPATGVYFRDKSLQKRRVAAAGVATAATTVIEDIYDVSAFTTLPYARGVLKPVAGAATARTSIVESVAQLQAASLAYRRTGVAQRTFVLEEHVGGDEWVADGIVFDGEVLFCAMGTYGAPCLTVVDQELPLWLRRFDPETEAWAYSRGEPVVRRALSALGLRDGVFHMEFFHDPATGELTFSECAARRGGALVHEEMLAKFNVHLGEAALLCALGRRPEPAVKIRPGVIGGTYLMGRPGTLFRCPSPADLTALPGVEYARIEFPAGGQFAPGVGSTNQRVGQVLVSADSESALIRRFDEVREWFDERLLVAPHDATMRDRRAWQHRIWPDADFRDHPWQ
jgi:hypothetical protein